MNTQLPQNAVEHIPSHRCKVRAIGADKLLKYRKLQESINSCEHCEEAARRIVKRYNAIKKSGRSASFTLIIEKDKLDETNLSQINTKIYRR